MTIKEVEKTAANRLGLSYEMQSDLDPADRLKLWDAMADVILENPSDYLPAQVDWATKRRRSGLYGVAPANYGLGERIADFTEEVGNQAVKINEDINPFSGSNRTALVVTVVGGLLVYLLAPTIIKAFIESKGAK